jgi:hypothetical protein
LDPDKNFCRLACLKDGQQILLEEKAMTTKRINIAILLIIYLAIAIGIGLGIAKLNARLAAGERLDERRTVATLNTTRVGLLVNGRLTTLHQGGSLVVPNAVLGPELLDAHKTLQTLELDGVRLSLDTLTV